MKTKLQCAKTAMFALACFSSVGVFGQTKITDENGLKAIAQNLSGDYVLGNDITLSGEWEPIGTDDAPFTGTIDGKGFTIYGLKINRPEQNSVGFIGAAKIEESGSSKITVKDLRLVGVEIFGYHEVGAVIGNSFGAKVSQCYTSGLVHGDDHVGGIIGGTKRVNEDDEILTTVSNSYSTAAVISSGHQAGGIIGAGINASVDHCYFAGIASCVYGRSGGIVALCDAYNLTISNCVVLSSYIKAGAAGIGGANAILGADNTNDGSTAVSTISSSYSWDGLKLYENNVLMPRGYSATDSYDGEHTSIETLKTANFWYSTVGFDGGIWTIAEGSYPSLSGVQTPLKNYLYIPTFPERCLPGATFNAGALSASGRTITYNSSNPSVATISDEGLVTFIQDGTTTLTFTDTGDSYVEGVQRTYDLEVKGVAYTIMNEEDLRCIKYDLEGDYTLGADIYLTKDWELMGAFTGTLNGQGYAIHNLRYVKEDQGSVGLFGEAHGATIQKVGIVGAYINGNADVGAIVGDASGCTISECFVDQSSYIAGRDHIGSIVGRVKEWKIDDGGNGLGTTVSDCYSMARVYSREFQAGGIAGVVNYGTVERCYFSGNVQARSGRAGGIFSLVDADGTVFVQNNVCLASGIYCPDATFCIGEKSEGRTNAQLIDNYFGETASYKGADLASSSITDNASDGTKAYDEDVVESSFYEGLDWDLNNVWTFVDGGEGKMYPILKCQQSKEVTPLVYGIPNPAVLIQTKDLAARTPLDLGKIKTTTGQKLSFDVTKGENYVGFDGNLLEFIDFIPNEEMATISISTPEISGVKPINISSFDVQMISSDYIFPISSAQDLVDANNKLYANFRLTNNIDMTGVAFHGIGSLDAPYTGTFDGNGYSVINPVVITDDENTKGFFNATKDAKIKNLGIANISFSGSQAIGPGRENKNTDIGGFAGSAKNTTFDQCYLTGKVVGRDHVGGFVGGNCEEVTITNSYLNADVLGYSQVGGFFGVATGNVVMQNCYFAGSAKENPSSNYGWAGGFVGLIDRDAITVTIQDCVSIGDVQADIAAGQFIGGNGGAGESDDYKPRAMVIFTGNVVNGAANKLVMSGDPSQADWESTGYLIKNGENIESASLPIPAYSDQGDFFQKATYQKASFDFDAIWTIEEGVSYPTLKKVSAVGIGKVVNKDKSYNVSVDADVITISGIEDTAKVALYNMNGQVMSQCVTSEDSAQLSAAGKGIYIVRIIEKETTTTIKLIVK